MKNTIEDIIKKYMTEEQKEDLHPEMEMNLLN